MTDRESELYLAKSEEIKYRAMSEAVRDYIDFMEVAEPETTYETIVDFIIKETD